MSGARILVVDDDDNVRAVAMRQLKSLGYDVIAASGGEEALGLLASHPDLDLLFVDISMPGGLSGPEVAERATAERGGLKVLFASGNFDAALPEASHFIVKPYRKHELAEKLKEVFGPSTSPVPS